MPGLLQPTFLGLAIFAACIVLFCLLPRLMPQIALLGCALMVALGVAFYSVVFGQFASNPVFLVMGMMVVGAAMGEAGLTSMIDRALSRLVRGSERGFLMILCVLCALLSAFMSNVATMALVIPIAEGYCRAHGRDSRSFLLPIAMSCLVGGSCTLIGSAPQLVAQGIMEELTGTGFGFFEFARIGTLQLGLLLLYIFLRFPTMEKVWNTRQPDAAHAAESRPIVERRKFFLVTSVFLAALVLFYFEPIPLPVTSVLAALICIFTGCISSKRAVAAISPVVVVKLGASLGLVQALKSSGGFELLSSLLDQIIPKSIPSRLLLCVLCLVTMLLSEFLSNSTALMITFPVAISLCLARELNTATFAMALIFSSTALSTPLSATPLMMIMGERYHFSDYTRYGMAFDMMTLLIAVFVVPILYPIAF